MGTVGTSQVGKQPAHQVSLTVTSHNIEKTTFTKVFQHELDPKSRSIATFGWAQTILPAGSGMWLSTAGEGETIGGLFRQNLVGKFTVCNEAPSRGRGNIERRPNIAFGQRGRIARLCNVECLVGLQLGLWLVRTRCFCRSLPAHRKSVSIHSRSCGRRTYLHMMVRR